MHTQGEHYYYYHSLPAASSATDLQHLSGAFSQHVSWPGHGNFAAAPGQPSSHQPTQQNSSSSSRNYRYHSQQHQHQYRSGDRYTMSASSNSSSYKSRSARSRSTSKHRERISSEWSAQGNPPQQQQQQQQKPLKRGGTDWACSCGCSNWASRQVCKNCGAAQPDSGAVAGEVVKTTTYESAAPPREPAFAFYPPLWGFPSRQAHFEDPARKVIPTTDMIPQGAAVSTPPVNFAWPTPFDHTRLPDTRQRSLSAGTATNGKPAAAKNTSAPVESKFKVLPDGRWACQCEAENSKAAYKCYRCHVPRKEQEQTATASSAQAKRQDADQHRWKCQHCGKDDNIERHQRCDSCQQPRRLKKQAPAADGDDLAEQMQRVRLTEKKPEPWRSADRPATSVAVANRMIGAHLGISLAPGKRDSQPRRQNGSGRPARVQARPNDTSAASSSADQYVGFDNDDNGQDADQGWGVQSF